MCEMGKEMLSEHELKTMAKQVENSVYTALPNFRQ